MNLILSFLSHDWAGLVLAGVVAVSGVVCFRAARSRRKTWLVAVGCVVLGIGGLMALGSAYHLVHMARARAQHPPPGKLVDVGGYRLHVLAEGEARGKPTIVWIPGAHSAGFSLHHLHRMLRDEARSILIDRPGSGWSDIGPFPRTTAVEAEEVFKALQQSGEQGPFVFVGHSLGGLLAANIARRHPQIVAGVVLLDATPPDAINHAPPNPFLSEMRRDALLSAVQRLFGIHADVAQKLWGRAPDPTTQRITDLTAQRLGPVLEDVRAVEDAARSSTANASIFEELQPGGMSWDNTVYDGDLDDLPLFLVAPRELEEFKAVAAAMAKSSAQEDVRKDSQKADQVGPPAIDAKRLHRFYTRTRERYMQASSRSERIYAPQGTGHNFPYEAPEFVADVLRRVLADLSNDNELHRSAAIRTPGDEIEFDLVLRSEVDIKAPPSVVWKHLERIQEWKDSVVSVERIEGARNEVGEVLRIGQRPAKDTVYVMQKTLELEQDAWKVQSLVTEDGRTTSGYVIYSLYGGGLYAGGPHGVGSGTRVVCELVARARAQARDLHGLTADQLSHLANKGTRAKLDADLRALKRLIERA